MKNMLKDIYWRRYPIDLLNDDKMLYIESLMPEKLKYAPYMFYITALKLADDDGVFDLEDGVIFARLMRVPDVQIVFEVANLMRQRKVIYRLLDDSNYCGLTDWEYAKNEKVRFHRTPAADGYARRCPTPPEIGRCRTIGACYGVFRLRKIP